MEKFKIIGAIVLICLSTSCKKYRKYKHQFNLTINSIDILNNVPMAGMRWTVKEYKTKSSGLISKTETSESTGWELNGVTTADGPTCIVFERKKSGQYDYTITMDPTTVVPPSGTFWGPIYRKISYSLSAGTAPVVETYKIGFLPSMNATSHVKNVNCQGPTDSMATAVPINLNLNPNYTLDYLNSLPYTGGGFGNSFSGCADFNGIYGSYEVGYYRWKYKLKRNNIITYHVDTIFLYPGINDVLEILY
jgi:hypothetical protein